MSMITATAWVPRGYAAQFPTKYDFTEEEYSRISKLAQRQLEEAQEDLDEARRGKSEAKTTTATTTDDGATSGVGVGGAVANGSNGKPKPSDDNNDNDDNDNDDDDDLKEYDLEHYDDDNDDDISMSDGDRSADGDSNGNTLGIFGNVKSLVYHESNDDDPYITLPENEASDDDEREEMQILATDNLILSARVEDEVAHLEVYVYEDEADNLYVHHDIMLPAIPLAVEWIDMAVGKKDVGGDNRGNFVAVGTLDPDIELWDLDTVDCMYPNAILGQGGQQQQTNGLKPKKKKKKSRKPHPDYHVDSVLSLAANRQHRNLLASASADSTVKLWDLHMEKCAQSYTYHTDKVSSIAWHPKETTALLSGSYDKTIVAGDMRAPEAGQRRWRLDSDVENVRWDPHDPNYFYASTDSGMLHYFDARLTPSSSSSSNPNHISPATWRLQAHDSSISCFDVNPIIPGFVVTGSADKQVKLWNIPTAGAGNKGPSMVTARDLDVGRVFSTTFGPDAEVGFRLAVAGSKGNMQVWDTSTNAAVRAAFASRVAAPEAQGGGGGGIALGEVQERLISLNVEDDEDDSSEDGMEDEGEGEGGEHEGEGWEEEED